MTIREQALSAKKAAARLASVSTEVKNKALAAMAAALMEKKDEILAANAEDVKNARAKNIRESMIDRLTLNEKRLKEMSEGLLQVASLKDPVGEIISGTTLANGMTLTKIRVPLGVLGIIYEARPNVTSDAIGLALKSGNAVILKGGSEAILSNTAISGALADAAYSGGIPEGAVQFIKSTDRAAVKELITLTGLVDCVIPRGGAGLIRTVVENATVPVIETGVGVCHTFVDEGADYEKAVQIVLNAKCQRPSTCNALETLLVHEKAAKDFLPLMMQALKDNKVTAISDEGAFVYAPWGERATEEDWATEYGDLRLSVKIVKDVDEAIEHISRYGTKHSEAILTKNYDNARKFKQQVDAAVVYVNASTRFTDGFQFGFGAEIGISTQKLHARGPMALPELTSYKYLAEGDWIVRK